MSDDAEFGPWIEHDGRPRNVRGVYPGARVEVVGRSGARLVGVVAPNGTARKSLDCPSEARGLSWNWEWRRAWLLRRIVVLDNGNDPIIRYRIRRPKALRDLITLVETLPAPAQPMVDA